MFFFLPPYPMHIPYILLFLLSCCLRLQEARSGDEEYDRQGQSDSDDAPLRDSEGEQLYVIERLLTVGCAEVPLSIELGGKAVEKRTIAGKKRLICWAMLPMLSKNMKAGT